MTEAEAAVAAEAANVIGGRYELIEEIGSGGMGTIWRGFDVVLDREVAVKLIRTDIFVSTSEREELAHRFQREARVTARIRHHGVPQVYDAVLDHSAERLYLVMELVHGTSLRAFVGPAQPMPTTWAAALGAQICTVLSHAHAIPVVHRDLKPDNVLITDGGVVKVLDFGIAAILRAGVTRLTATGVPLGTSQYMAPEQIQGGTVSPQSDLYALGCVLHELLCGYPVVDGDSEFKRWQQHVYGSPLPLREARADVPAEFEHLVLELLAKTPEQRPADVHEVYRRLLLFLPAPGGAPETETVLATEMPDPTLVFRKPNAPRSPVESAPFFARATLEEADSAASKAPRTALRESIKEAVGRADVLLGDQRYAQAADVLEAVIKPAGDVLGAENPRVLKLRARRGAILVIGGDFRRALPEFDALAAAYARNAGPHSADTVECLKQAAFCRAELGHTSTALRQFQDVLVRMRANDGDASDDALEIRRHIGMLQLAEDDKPGAVVTLEALLADLHLVYGVADDNTREVAELLERIRLADEANRPTSDDTS